MLLKRIKYYKISFLFNFSFFFISNLLLFYLIFLTSSHFLPTLSSFQSIDENSIYISYPSQRTTSYLKEIEGNAYYVYENIKVNEAELLVLCVNEEALKKGFLMQGNQVYLIDLNLDTYEFDTIYSNQHNQESIFHPSIKIPKLSPIFNPYTDSQIYLMVKKEPYFVDKEKILIIAPHDPKIIEFISEREVVNQLSSSGFVFDGAGLKKHQANVFQSLYTFLLLFALLPILMVVFSNINLFHYQISQRYREIIIRHLYYEPRNTMIRSLRNELMITNLLSIILAVIGTYLFVGYYDTLLFLSVVLGGCIYNLLIATFIASRTIKKIYKVKGSEMIKMVNV